MISIKKVSREFFFLYQVKMFFILLLFSCVGKLLICLLFSQSHDDNLEKNEIFKYSTAFQNF
jgi:hypothetical protein